MFNSTKTQEVNNAVEEIIDFLFDYSLFSSMEAVEVLELCLSEIKKGRKWADEKMGGS